MTKKSLINKQEASNISHMVPFILAVIFTFALIFLTFEITMFVHQLLIPIFEDVHPAFEPEKIINIINATRPIGYLCLFIVIIFIILGFLIKREIISVSSSFLLFLPTFAGFAPSMFFLAGIGIIEVIWLPLYTPYFNFLRLGDILVMPAIFLMILFIPFMILPGIFILIGSLIFSYGVISWIHGKYHKKEFIDFFAYKYSRHPQYMGFLLYSYGLLITYKEFGTLYGVFGQITLGASLPWVIFALILLGVAFMEDINLSKRLPNEYNEYRKSTPFFIKLPKPIKSILSLSFKIIIRKKFPETRKDVIKILIFYGIIIIFLSLLTYPLFSWFY